MNNDQRDVLRFELSRAKEAQRNKTQLEMFFEAREEAIISAFRQTTTDNGRLTLQIRLNEMDALRDDIESVIASGKMAAQALD